MRNPPVLYLRRCLLLLVWLGLAGCQLADQGAGTTNGSPPVLLNANLLATEVTSNALVLQWDPPKDDHTNPKNIRYQVYISGSTALDTWEKIVKYGTALSSPQAGINFYQVENLTSDNGYYFNVVAFDEGDQHSIYTYLYQRTAASSANSAVPSYNAQDIDFVDSDPDSGEVFGRIDLTRATNESDLDSYVVYWGSGTSTKASSTPIATLGKTGQDLSYSFLPGTTYQSGATYILVYSANEYGESASPLYVAVSDLNTTDAAQGISFTDTDTAEGSIGGTVTVRPKTSETSTQYYYLYWGADSSGKDSSTAITSFTPTGSTLTYSLASGTSLASSSTHLLLYHYNASNVEASTPIAVQIKDLYLPPEAPNGVSFYDQDSRSGWVKGTITLSKASDETRIESYSLYWGSDASTKSSSSPFLTLDANNASMTYDLPATEVSSSAAYILAYSTNSVGDSSSLVSTQLVDLDLITDRIAHYPMNGSGEAKGSDQEGTLVNEPASTTDRAGLPNQGLYLLKEAKDYVDLGSDDSFRPKRLLSFGGWFYKADWLSECDSLETLISNYQKGGYALYCDGGMIKAKVFRRDGADLVVETNAANLDGWGHIYVTFNARILKLYLNGVEEAEADGLTSESITYFFENNLLVGAEAGQASKPEGGKYFRGKVDELRFFNRVLTAAEVEQLYLSEVN